MRNLDLPPLLSGDAEQQLRQLKDYLVRLILTLNEEEEAATTVEKQTVTKVVTAASPSSGESYESLPAEQGGTAKSLVLTGEKYIWNSKGNYSKPAGGIPDSDIASASTWSAKYDKPSSGIPDADIASAATWNAKGTYSKPSGGIPKSDLAAAVQTSLGKADTALQTAPVTSVNSKTGAVVLTASDVGAGTYSKPSGGIPDSDIASAASWNAKGTYSKPAGGIPDSDIASAATWNSKMDGDAVVPISQGGTGATTAVAGLFALGGLPKITIGPLSSTTTATLTFSGQVRFLLVISGNSTARQGIAIVFGTQSISPSVNKIGTVGSNITLTAGTGNLTIATSGGTVYAYAFCLDQNTYGRISVAAATA